MAKEMICHHKRDLHMAKEMIYYNKRDLFGSSDTRNANANLNPNPNLNPTSPKTKPQSKAARLRDQHARIMAKKNWAKNSLHPRA